MMSGHNVIGAAIVIGACILAPWASGARAELICDFEQPTYTTTGGSDGAGALDGQGGWFLYNGEHPKVSTENPLNGSQSLKLASDGKVAHDLGEDFGDEVTLKIALSRDSTDAAGTYGGLFVYLGTEGVDQADFSKTAAQFGLGLDTGVVTYRDGGSYVSVAPFAASQWYTFEASIHFDDTDPNGGSYDLKITSTDPNWTDFIATGIQFRGGSAAVGAEDILVNRFQSGTLPDWVDGLSIGKTVVPEPSAIIMLAGIICFLWIRRHRDG